MPATEFSEFTYGYAVMQETEKFLTQHAGSLTMAPDQPSLITENIVGYDAKFVTVDFAVLLQFKVPFYTSRQHSRGACGPGHCTWSAWGREHPPTGNATSTTATTSVDRYSTSRQLRCRPISMVCPANTSSVIERPAAPAS